MSLVPAPAGFGKTTLVSKWVTSGTISWVRFAGVRLQQRLTGSRAESWQRAQAWMQRQGAVALLETRWALTSLDVPTNWIASSSDYGTQCFLIWDLI